jgi:transcription elongation factor Elf1
MKRYCAQDVVLLEKVWEKLSKVVPAKTHAGVMEGRDKWSCPHCASEKVHKVRAYVTAKGVEQQQMKCSDCGSYHNISAAARKDYENAKKRAA